MPLGQSALFAMMTSGAVKRCTYLAHLSLGSTRYEADLKSDDYAIAAATASGVLLSIVTVDPIGAAGTSLLVAGLEGDLAKKKKGE